MKNGRKAACLLAVCLCLVMIWYMPALWQKKESDLTARARRQLITVWIYGDQLNASSWVRQQAAAYQKKHAGVNIWVRTVTAADIACMTEDYQHAAPDILLFMAGAEIDPQWVQKTAPLCMAGYALVAQKKDAATIVPTSLFGVTPAPEKAEAITPVPKEAWPGSMAADDGLGAWFLQQMGAMKGARLLPNGQVQDAFCQGQVQAALLSTQQIRALAAQGVGMQLLCAAPGSDLVLFGAWMQQAEPAAEAVWQHFLSEEAQTALAQRGLFSPQGLHLYGAGTPILAAVEAAIRKGWLPDPFLWPQEKMEKVHAGQLLYAAQ